MRFEPLVRRELLHGGRIAWAELPQLTLSFAPDGVDIAGEENELSGHMRAQFGDGDWRDTILRAFQTWAIHTNANVGAVGEVGANAFGTPGARAGDNRFGDIRIGARPLTSDVLAVSISQNTLISGTWAGDVIFNSLGSYQSLDELFSVALHEAGHVFGLSHSDDRESPMYVHGISSSIQPLPEDIENLQALYGDRMRDAYEGRGGNDRMIAATNLSLNARMRDFDGSAPSIVFADLTTERDVDFYRIDAPHHYSGPISIRLRSEGISLLEPSLTVFNDQGTAIFSSDPRSRERVIDFRVENPRRGGDLFVQVDASRSGVFAIGAYSLVVNFDRLNQVDAATIDELSGNSVRQLEWDDIDSFFRSGDRRLFRDDGHTDDHPDAAQRFDRLRFSEELVSLRTLGSIADPTDVDYYRFESPGRFFAPGIAPYISVRSLELGGLIPRIMILDDQNQPVDYQILVNGNGELLVQLDNVQNEQSLKLAVSSGGNLPAFQRGNYELNVFFTKTPIEFQSLAAGRIDAKSVSTHRLHVATPQLFHLALAVDGDDQDSGVLMRLVDESERIVESIASPRGQTRSSGSTLLLPGTYTMQVIPLVASGAPSEAMNFSVYGEVISDPFGIDPVLPDDTEFTCPGLGDEYCYPSGNVSTVPFDWEEFLSALEDLDIDAAQVSDSLLGDWWSTYWQTTADADPPISAPDSYVMSDSMSPVLRVSAADGVLANDRSEFATIIASVTRFPDHGELSMEYDGGFVYTPQEGFLGIDKFEYVASDFRHTSAATTVSIAVRVEFAAGDLNRNGTIDAADIDLLAAGIRIGTDLAWDLNSDGRLDDRDHHFMVSGILGTTLGDANLDGRFDSTDLVLVFQAAHFEDTLEGNSGWRDGDWNGDGEFNTSDLVAAFQSGGYVEVAIIAITVESGQNLKENRDRRTSED
jgi:hypothetical protein